MKSSRHCALRCSASAGASCSASRAGRLGGDDRVDQIDDRRAAALQQRVVAIWMVSTREVISPRRSGGRSGTRG
jgi:hypothetical protein